jgi:TolB-like protein/cytochrome c-type biogenesis protein CcmH/NrfG
MSDPNKAVFLSYASQDAEAARRICDALRAAGVEVWFDQSELVGGDQWDQKIRKQIKDCALLIPVISAATQARLEGYFRLEWKLAAQRTHTMADAKPFLLPVVIDATRDAEAHVPEEFRAVQWTRLPGGEASENFCTRLKQLLAGTVAGVANPGPASKRSATTRTGGGASPSPAGWRRRVPATAWIGALVMVLGIASYLALRTKPSAGPPTSAPTTQESAPLSAARQLVAKAWVLMNKTELGRAELEAADELCKRAAALDSTDTDVQAAWSQVDTWFVFHNFDATPERRERARIKAARALQLAPAGYEARLAQACYLVRGGGDQNVPMDSGVAEDLLKGLLREKPDEPRALFALGILQVNLDRLAQARATFGRLAENPAFAATAWNEIGWAEWSQADDYRAAEVAADRSIALQPYWGNLSLKSHLAWRWRGDLDMAMAAQLRIPAVERAEDHGVSHACELYFLRREPTKGLRLLDTVARDWLRSNGYEGPKAIWAALAEEQLGRKDRAEVQWQAALKLLERRLDDQSDSNLLLGLKAYVLAALGRSADAENTMRLMRDDDSGAAKGKGQNSRAVIIYARLGQADKALDLLEKDPRLTAAVARIDPRFDSLRALPRFQALQARLDADPRSSPTAKGTTPKDATATKVSDKSVAVLAFANLSDDKANEYFSDGISEELLNVLAKVPGLKVTARTSSFFFKGKDTPIPEIAQKLGVAYVVEGSVRKQGSKVRITAQLIKAADGFHVWSDTFTRDLKDIFAVQDEIAGLVAKTLELKMGLDLPARRTVDPEAFRLLLSGRAKVRLSGNANRDAGIADFRAAVSRSPDYAEAWAEMAHAYIQNARFGGVSLEAGFQEARQAIAKALAIAPDSPEVLAAAGWVRRTADWDWRGASQAFHRAVELSPENADILTEAAETLVTVGQIDEAIQLGRRAVALDPLNPAAHFNLSFILSNAGHLPESMESARRAVELAPGAEDYHSNLAVALADLGRLDEAEKELALESHGDVRITAEAMILVRRGQKAAARAKVRELEGLPNRNNDMAEIHAENGDTDLAFAALERSYARHETGMPWVKVDPYLRSLHSDPRWPGLLRKMGLADDQLK